MVKKKDEDIYLTNFTDQVMGSDKQTRAQQKGEHIGFLQNNNKNYKCLNSLTVLMFNQQVTR